MAIAVDLVLASLCGSRTRLLTLEVLANADEPLTGYRVAKVANLPRQRVYPQLRRSLRAGSVRKSGSVFALNDPDVKRLLRNGVRIRRDQEWHRARRDELALPIDPLTGILKTLKGVRIYDPGNRIPDAALRELERDLRKNRVLRRDGARASSRKD
jgi:hypothetical protein